jgi:hypothetical protein
MRIGIVASSWLVVAFALSAQSGAATILTFPGSTFNPNTAAMDQALGVTGYTIEGFESTALVPGLSITLSGFSNGAPDETLTSLPRLYAPGQDFVNTRDLSSNLWDGAHAFNNTPDASRIVDNGGIPPTAALTTFSFAGGASSVGIGLANFQSLSDPSFPVTDHRLLINGVAVPGTLESIAGNNFTSGIFARNAYLRIDAGSGETIQSIGFQNINNATGGRDFLVFDHLAIRSAVAVVPEPSTLALALAGLALWGLARRRASR